jgi:hypothetical protein
MNAHQGREVSNEHDVAIIADLLASEAGDQRDRQYAQALEHQHIEEPEGDDNISDEEMNDEFVDDLDDLPDGVSDFEPEADAEERQLTEEPDDQDYMSDDEMNLDDEDLRDMLDDLSYGLPDFGPEEETEQQDHQLIAPEDPATQTSPQPRTKECDVCKGTFPIMTTLRLPCSDSCCHPCLIRHLTASLKNEFLFPPKCCGEEIPIKASERFLPSDLVQKYHEKMVEHKTKDRTYCINLQCLKFIPPKNLSESGEPCYKDEEQCSNCFEITCTKCKSKAHNGACEKQVARDQVLALAEEEGWKQCGRCGHLIELTLGCIHMGKSPNQSISPFSHLLNYFS